MADLDAELLALAGGDSSSDDEDTTKTHPKSESPASSAISPPGTQNRDAEVKLGVARKKDAKPAATMRKSQKRAKREESEEEGEACVHFLIQFT